MNEGLKGLNISNLQAALKQRCLHYESQLDTLRQLIQSEGITVDNLSRRRSEMIQQLAVELGMDMSSLARVRLEIAGAPTFKGIFDEFMWYLKDVRDALRLFALAEVRDG